MSPTTETETGPASDSRVPAPRPAAVARRRRARLRLHTTGLLFALPALLLYGVFVLYPLLASLFGSLYAWIGVQRGGFVGLGNFRRLLSGAQRGAVASAFWHNCLWFAGIMVLQTALGLLIAWLLFLRGRRYRFFQSVFFFPALLSPVLVGALWRLILMPDGPGQAILHSLGLSTGKLTWLGDPHKALWILIAVDAWNWIGLPILVFAGALNAMPAEIFEAAALDGARAGRMLRSIAIPSLLPAVASLTTLTVINAFNQFDTVYVMEGVGGDPSRSTDVLVTQFYRLAFGAVGSSGITDIGLALALGGLLFVFLAVCSVLILRFFDRKAIS
ncbi:carbohydrate ABC transporter permease [Actinoallomurus acaciae]|uniref:Carbohydrate ABC transporter permease n=1 Tax=Actinoallomurus acaciae TaxID=502577 RepID=A0ABV5YJK1_9ACTN